MKSSRPALNLLPVIAGYFFDTYANRSTSSTLQIRIAGECITDTLLVADPHLRRLAIRRPQRQVADFDSLHKRGDSANEKQDPST
jgi:hypothetical protein